LGCAPDQQQGQPDAGEGIEGDKGGGVQECQGSNTDLPVIEVGEDVDSAEPVGLANATGQQIRGLAVKHVLSGSYGILPIRSEDGVWVPGQTARIHYAPPASTPATGGGTEDLGPLASEAVLNDLYNIRITFADSTEAVLHELNPLAMTDACIKDADGIVYVEYNDPVYGTVSTLEFERAYPRP
jgi:hypothetical protein